MAAWTAIWYLDFSKERDDVLDLQFHMNLQHSYPVGRKFFATLGIRTLEATYA